MLPLRCEIIGDQPTGYTHATVLAFGTMSAVLESWKDGQVPIVTDSCLVMFDDGTLCTIMANHVKMVDSSKIYLRTKARLNVQTHAQASQFQAAEEPATV